MAILKKEYELSVWDETLGVKGQKEEIKRAIIGAHDMTYDGRATALKLSRKINGTNVLTFQMPSKYFDSKLGEYVHNEFCDYIFNERKLKLKYDGEWFEFYVKNINENKQFKSIMYQYQCEDAFIDELSRNGYGITFDTELYNNVEEIGVFTEQILEDSVWQYDASKNWGDFTEFNEEKLFKIPVSMFDKIVGYKINYDVSNTEEEEIILTNSFSGETRKLEMGDDLSRQKKIFWDNGKFDKGISLLNNKNENITNDGYIYVPYSCLDFCYVSNDKDGEGFAATEEPVIGIVGGIKSYYLTPKTIDPTSLIQFIAIPHNAELKIDEAGLIVNKEYSYVMTLADWNENVNTKMFYNLENKTLEEGLVSNKIVGYEGYLEKIGDTNISFGKKISITDRTEINISEEIDQYVVVYNNSQEEYSKNNMFTSEEWKDDDNNYRICSYEATRMIIPQLARNLVQNGTEMTDTSGWEVMKTLSDVGSVSSSISVRPIIENAENQSSTGGLLFLPQCSKLEEVIKDKKPYKTFINFGIVGQEEKISKEQTYIFRLTGMGVSSTETKDEDGNKIIEYEDGGSLKTRDIRVIIGEGGYDSEGDYTITETIVLENIESGQNYFIRPSKDIKNPYIAIQFTGLEGGKYGDSVSYYNLQEFIFAKAYTKGVDFFNSDINKGVYKYTGRDIFFDKNDGYWSSITGGFWRKADVKEFLSETDIVEGDTYSYKRYFRQQIQTQNLTKDTFMLKSYLNNEIEKNGFDPTEYTEEDFKIITDYIDLNKCKYYNFYVAADEKDCKHPDSVNGLCMYQKYGYCPYQFQTQKHCRKIRTLNGEKSNRFNLTQELSKVFEVYPVYYIEHENNGKIIADVFKDVDGKEYEKMRKKVFYITEKGTENKLGFKYEKNLSDISRTFDSKEIVTKLYVEDVDSEISKTGMCSIKTAEDNPSKDNYIIDFSYYTMRGLLNEEKTNADLYGIDGNDMGYLKKLGYYNNEYDKLSNLIINLQDESYTELEANIEVNLTGIETALKELNKIKKNMTKYSTPKKSLKKDDEENNIEASETYNNYKIKYDEQKTILLGLVKDTFMTDSMYDKTLAISYKEINKDIIWGEASTAEEVLNNIVAYGFKNFKEQFLDTFKYQNFGMMGQFTAEYLQIQKWKKERAKYLKDINKISLEFYQKYEPFLKEGTWSDSNYLSDNSYYFGAKEVAKQGAIPKLTYNISVIDLSILDKDYKVGVADSTYIEDIETFGINQKTGLPNRLKAIISGITYDLDLPTQNSIEIQNYTTQFEDLFQQVSASVQSLSFNENIYKRSSNFTATKNISGDSLQGSLLENHLTLMETDEKNISLDQTGQSGSDINNHANRYKLSGEGLFFSNNGGQTWNIGVTPKGINADYINVGSLDASKISIVDGNYLYFLWDKGGITAYREPQPKQETNYFQDFARFNKYGLSLVENGQIKLRAGYSFNGEQGKMSSESEIGENIGFYLYNSTGDTIFSTETSKNADANKKATETAKIRLKGELYVTNDSYTKGKEKVIYNYSKSYEIASVTYYNVNKINYSNVAYKIDTKNNGLIFTEGKGVTSEYDFIKFIIFYCQTNNQMNLLKQGNVFSWTEAGENGKTFSVTLEKKSSISNQKILKNVSYNTYELLQKALAEYIFINTKNQKKHTIYHTNINKECFISSGVTRYSILTKESYTEKTQSEKLAANTLNVLKNITGNTYQLTTKSLFSNDNKTFYEIEEKQTEEGDYIKGQTGLYINNNQAWQNSNSEKIIEQERLFCIAKNDKKEEEKSEYVSNIFTVLRNGNLYMGGELQSQKTSLSTTENLPAEINVENYDIAIEDGQMKIDFTNIVNKEGEDLFEFIVNQVNSKTLPSHSHKLKLPNKLYILLSAQSMSGTFPVTIDINNIPFANRLLFALTGDESALGGKFINIKSEELDVSSLDITESMITWETSLSGSGTGGSGGFFSGYAWPDIIDQ